MLVFKNVRKKAFLKTIWIFSYEQIYSGGRHKRNAQAQTTKNEKAADKNGNVRDDVLDFVTEIWRDKTIDVYH